MKIKSCSFFLKEGIMHIIPVINNITNELTFLNADICHKNNTFGVMLISMTGDNENLSSLAKIIKGRYPNLKVGINLLGVSALNSLDESLTFGLDMTWSDNPIITSDYISDDAYLIKEKISKNEHLFFNSVAFKYQKIDNNPAKAAQNSKEFNFIPTTSGLATGVSADLTKIKSMKESIDDYPLALASGLTPSNIKDYLPYISYGLVSTGISSSFHELDSTLTAQLMQNSL